MPRAPATLLLALATLTVGLAGCLGTDEVDPASFDAGTGDVPIVVAGGDPVDEAQVTLLDPDGAPIEAFTVHEGRLEAARLAGPVDAVAVDAGEAGSWRGPLADVGDRIQLDPPAAPSTSDPAPVLGFEQPLRLGAAHLAGHPSTCEFYNCGASEPVLEVASDGTVYVSGTCCIGESPPIWVSRDNGETFQRLTGDVLRESFGIEGDFAIDDAGNLYFTDISAANAYIASWDGDGEHRHTVPAGPFVPLVDRPWVRAGGEDLVHFFYNTGSSTMYYQSTDGGLTWTPQHEFAGALGTPGQGPTREDLWVTADDRLFHSPDAGASWEEIGALPRPSDDGATFQAYDVPVVDEAGNVWITYDWRNGTDQDPFHVYAVRYDGDAFSEPVRVSPEDGTHHLPWAAAGSEGSLALAWYGTLDDEAGPNEVAEDAEWYVHAAVSVDADTDDPDFQTTRADPALVHEGPMNRKLLDFLQVEIGPDGRVHVAYAQDRNGQPDEATQYARSTPGLDLAPHAYLNGPRS